LRFPGIARKEVAEQNPTFRSLLAAAGIERGVAAALKAALSIKIAFLARAIAGNEL